MEVDGFRIHKQQLKEVEINYAMGGQGEPMVMLHGFPQTHFIWHKIAPKLTQHFTVILPDLRGYGDSSKPEPLIDHSNYSKRAVANDIVELMQYLGHESFYLVGHDRGARVAHRLALDHPNAIKKLVLLDIVPTYDIFKATNKEIALHHYHWFFLSQKADLPETLLENSAEYYLKKCLFDWSKTPNTFSDEIVKEYLRCFKLSATIRSMCEDYRAGATIDLIHDEKSLSQKIVAPLLVLWGKQGAMADHFDVLKCWQARAEQVEGFPVDCGHFVPEEAPEETLEAILEFIH